VRYPAEAHVRGLQDRDVLLVVGDKQRLFREPHQPGAGVGTTDPSPHGVALGIGKVKMLGRLYAQVDDPAEAFGDLRPGKLALGLERGEPAWGKRTEAKREVLWRELHADHGRGGIGGRDAPESLRSVPEAA
jgi:hypothetical protein